MKAGGERDSLGVQGGDAGGEGSVDGGEREVGRMEETEMAGEGFADDEGDGGGD